MDKEKDDTIIKNGLGSLINVNELPYPDYTIFEPERFYRPMQGKVLRILPIELHRGCPYTCGFCAIPVLYKRSWKALRPEMVIERLKYMEDTYGIKDFYFQEDNFAFDLKRVKGYLKRLLKRRWILLGERLVFVQILFED